MRLELGGTQKDLTPLLWVPPFSLFSATPVVQSLPFLLAPTQLPQKTVEEQNGTGAGQGSSGAGLPTGRAQPGLRPGLPSGKCLGLRRGPLGYMQATARGESPALSTQLACPQTGHPPWPPLLVAQFHLGSSRRVARRSVFVPMIGACGAEKPRGGLWGLAWINWEAWVRALQVWGWGGSHVKAQGEKGVPRALKPM